MKNKWFINWIKKMACKYTVLLCLIAVSSYAWVFLTQPNFLYPKERGIVENVLKEKKWVSVSRHSSKQEDIYRIIIKDIGSYNSISMDEIDRFGIDKMIGKEAIFRYSESKITGYSYIHCMYIDGQTVYEGPDHILEFLVSILFAFFSTWGGLYGLKVDYLKNNPSKPPRKLDKLRFS